MASHYLAGPDTYLLYLAPACRLNPVRRPDIPSRAGGLFPMFVVPTRGSRAVRYRLLASSLAAACLFAVGRPARAQTLPPTSPALPADSPAPSLSTDPAAPSLPTDSTAPSTIGSPAAPANPLIPVQPPPSANLFPAAALPGGTGTLPGGLPAAAPVQNPPAALSVATTTNNIGTARRFQYNVALTLGTTFDDNIFLEASSLKQSDVYFTIQPTVALGFGGGVGGSGQDNYVRFTYSPEVLLYLDHSELDTVQQFVTLSGAYHLPRITLTGSAGVQILDNTDVGNPHPYDPTANPTDPTNPQPGVPVSNNPLSNLNLDTGQRTRLNLYSTALDANYYVSDKVSYDVSGQFSDSEYQSQALLSSSTLAGSFFFNYSPTGKTTVGVGTTVGYLFADAPTPDQSFEQGNVRFSYAPSPKLLATGQVGLELRQSSARGGSDVSPVFELDTSYSPFDGTAISLTGNRQVEASAVLGGQDYTLTGFSVSVSQRFFQRAFLRLSVGYSHSDYVAETNDVNAARSDNYYFVQPGLDINLRDNLTLGGFYSFRSSASTENNRNYTDNQVGVRLTFGF